MDLILRVLKFQTLGTCCPPQGVFRLSGRELLFEEARQLTAFKRFIQIVLLFNRAGEENHFGNSGLIPQLVLIRGTFHTGSWRNIASLTMSVVSSRF